MTIFIVYLATCSSLKSLLPELTYSLRTPMTNNYFKLFIIVKKEVNNSVRYFTHPNFQ